MKLDQRIMQADGWYLSTSNVRLPGRDPGWSEWPRSPGAGRGGKVGLLSGLQHHLFSESRIDGDGAMVTNLWWGGCDARNGRTARATSKLRSAHADLRRQCVASWLLYCSFSWSCCWWEEAPVGAVAASSTQPPAPQVRAKGLHCRTM